MNRLEIRRFERRPRLVMHPRLTAQYERESRAGWIVTNVLAAIIVAYMIVLLTMVIIL